jgi:hypothetical protein
MADETLQKDRSEIERHEAVGSDETLRKNLPEFGT